MLLAAVLLVAVPVAAATLHPVDYLALQAVRRALSDMPGSRFFASWDFTGDPCGFAGVSCSGDGRVVTLALGDPRAGRGLSGALPPPRWRSSPSSRRCRSSPGACPGSSPPPSPRSRRSGSWRSPGTSSPATSPPRSPPCSAPSTSARTHSPAGYRRRCSSSGASGRSSSPTTPSPARFPSW